jgi:hypothetical protein
VKRGLASGTLATAALAGMAFLAGCGSVPAPSPTPGVPAVSGSLSTSLVTAQGSWAIVPMAANPAFWQVFVRPARGTSWQLVTPPGVADNGGLVAAGTGGSLSVAFRPSQNLTFSPLAVSANTGATWTTGLVDADVAAAPDALAASGGHLLALLQNGTVLTSADSGAHWTVLASPHAIADSAGGRRCALTGVTAVAFGPSGTPMVAGTCGTAGVAGVFSYSGGTWQAVAPSLPSGAAVDRLQVIRMTSTPNGLALLLQATRGPSDRLYAEWATGPAAQHWTVSGPLSLAGGQPAASGFGSGGAAWVLLPGGHAETIAGPGGSWRALPAPPADTATLAAGPGGAMDALAANGSEFTAWRLAASATAWSKVQTMKVPIEYGSSS